MQTFTPGCCDFCLTKQADTFRASRKPLVGTDTGSHRRKLVGCATLTLLFTCCGTSRAQASRRSSSTSRAWWTCPRLARPRCWDQWSTTSPRTARALATATPTPLRTQHVLRARLLARKPPPTSPTRSYRGTRRPSCTWRSTMPRSRSTTRYNHVLQSFRSSTPTPSCRSPRPLLYAISACRRLPPRLVLLAISARCRAAPRALSQRPQFCRCLMKSFFVIAPLSMRFSLVSMPLLRRVSCFRLPMIFRHVLLVTAHARHMTSTMPIPHCCLSRHLVTPWIMRSSLTSMHNLNVLTTTLRTLGSPWIFASTSAT
mmetsp:Transcript_88245/g.248418  ORF Transcript_88245/g.248418 Transcript_88245/m.248418 type:complete len:314 (+) Transcript_88245:101-1042(+)